MKLKASCTPFWLTWLLSGAYLLAISEFVDQFYVPENERLNTVNAIVCFVCVVMFVLALCGCCLIFCDVTSFACVLLYTIPPLFLVPAMCLFALTEIGRTEIPTNASIEKFVANDYWNYYKAKDQPRYLLETQVQMACCGLHGPADYRNFIYGEACQTTIIDVPYSCCNLSTLFHKPYAQILKDTCGTSMLDSENDAILSKCHGLFENIFTLDTSLVETEFSVNLTDNDLMERSNKCKYTNARTAILRKEYNDLIYQDGCLRHMIEKSEIIVNGNYMFLISSILVSLLMLCTFLKTWANSPEVLKNASYRVDSSMSQQTLIVEETKFKPLASHKSRWGRGN